MFKKENFTDDFIKFDNGFEIDENLGNQIILGPNGIGKSTIYNTILKIHHEYEHIDYEQLKSDFLKNKNKLKPLNIEFLELKNNQNSIAD